MAPISGFTTRTPTADELCEAMWGGKEDVERLLRKGAPVNTASKDGTMPIFQAILIGNPEVVRLLIENGVDLTVKKNGDEADPVLVYTARFSRLTHPDQSDKDEIVKLLIDAKAPLDAQGSDGYTALMWAAQRDFEKITRLLLDAGANLDIEDSTGSTALEKAESRDRKKIVQMIRDMPVMKERAEQEILRSQFIESAGPLKKSIVAAKTLTPPKL